MGIEYHVASVPIDKTNWQDNEGCESKTLGSRQPGSASGPQWSTAVDRYMTPDASNYRIRPTGTRVNLEGVLDRGQLGMGLRQTTPDSEGTRF
jgi:hypothetical protein